MTGLCPCERRAAMGVGLGSRSVLIHLFTYLFIDIFIFVCLALFFTSPFFLYFFVTDNLSLFSTFILPLCWLFCYFFLPFYIFIILVLFLFSSAASSRVLSSSLGFSSSSLLCIFESLFRFTVSGLRFTGSVSCLEKTFVLETETSLIIKNSYSFVENSSIKRWK